MKTITMKARSTSGAWTDVSLPAWITRDALVEARNEFQANQLVDAVQKLGYCPRTTAASWVRTYRPEWEKKFSNDFERLMVSYAICLERKAIKIMERDW